MKRSITKTLPAVAGAVLLCGSLIIFSGCQVVIDGGTNDGPDPGTGGSGAWVEFPDDPNVLMTIDEDDGIGSAVFYGYDGGEGMVVTGFEFDTSEETGTVLTDAAGRPTHLAIGSTTLDVEYNADGSFEYRIYENGQLLFQDDHVTAADATTKIPCAQRLRFDGFSYPACVIGRMEKWAARTISRREPGTSPDAVSAHSFTNCLKSNEALWNLARAWCVVAQSLLNRLEQASREEEESHEDYSDVMVALTFTAGKLMTALDGAAVSAAGQLWGSQDCTGGGDAASSEICGNGTCGEGENATNCPADCGSSEVCGNGICGTGESSATCPADCGPSTVCGNGTCESGANAANCPADCGVSVVCGNGVCETGEDTVNCPVDCPGGGEVTAASLSGCWALFGDLYDTNTGEASHLAGELILQIDTAGRLERLWAHSPTPDLDGISYQEFVRLTIPNAGIWSQAVTSTSSNVSVSPGGTLVSLDYLFTAYMWEKYTTEEDTEVCEVKTERQSTYRFELNNARLTGDPPTQFESDDVTYGISTTFRNPDTGEILTNSATRAGDLSGSYVDCPDPALPEVQSQEEACP